MSSRYNVHVKGQILNNDYQMIITFCASLSKSETETRLKRSVVDDWLSKEDGAD